MGAFLSGTSKSSFEADADLGPQENGSIFTRVTSETVCNLLLMVFFIIFHQMIRFPPKIYENTSELLMGQWNVLFLAPRYKKKTSIISHILPADGPTD